MVSRRTAGGLRLVTTKEVRDDQAAPSCVKLRHTAGIVTQTVYVTNKCSSTVSFIVHRVGPDSPCVHASPGHTRSYKWGNGLNYQGTTFGCD